MTIQDLGSIGELLAAIATIVTLVYLARQLRANTAAVRADARRANRAGSNATNLLIAGDPAVAAMFNDGLRDMDALPPEQRTQFGFLMAELIGSAQLTHAEFEAGIIDEGPLESVFPAYLNFLRTRGGRQWWSTYRDTFPPTFQAYLDAQLERQQD